MAVAVGISTSASAASPKQQMARPATAEAGVPPSPSVQQGKQSKKKDAIPAYMQPPFMKQISRTQAINGKLLEDNTMVRVLRGVSSNDVVYSPNYRSQSHSRDLGAVRRFGDMIGRTEFSKAGSRTAAQGNFPSHWRPTAPPSDAMTRPASASSGVAFHRQITRKQDVNGKLLENIAMTRFLFGSSATGPEYYENAFDSMLNPLHVSHRRRVGHGQHAFAKQLGRLALNRTGTRSAADGTFPSHWEPGMGYSDTIPRANHVAQFSKQNGRTELHLSGMRGAPPKASLAADYQAPVRPQSAMGALSGDANSGPPRRPRTAADAARPIPEGPRKHVEAHTFAKQLTREQWTSRPLR